MFGLVVVYCNLQIYSLQKVLAYATDIINQAGSKSNLIRFVVAGLVQEI